MNKIAVITLIIFLLPAILPAITNNDAEQKNGSIEASATSLYDFREVYKGNYSDVQFYQVSGEGLSEEVEITVDSPFRISINCYDGFESSITLPTEEGIFPETRIFVRFYPEHTGEKTGIIKHQSGSVETRTVSLSGTGIENSVPDGYYSTATASGSRLKTQLYEIITNHNVQTYASLWSHFENTDATFGGKVWDMYSDTPCDVPPYIYTFFEDQDTGTGGNQEGDVYNREHSMPRSWFGGAVDPMNTDLHHIFPVDKHVNAVRDNFPFGMVDSPSWTSANGGKLGTNVAGSFTGTVFEPIDDYKGDLARAFFYMVTRYENLIENWTYSEQGNNMFDHNKYPGYKSWVINMLMEWHENDPVSQKEIIRNNAVYQIQGNRNPFVDHPDFVEKIWGDTTVAATNISHDFEISVFPVPASEHFYFSAQEKIWELQIISLNGQIIMQEKPHSMKKQIDISQLESGIYIIRLYGNRNIFSEKLLVR